MTPKKRKLMRATVFLLLVFFVLAAVYFTSPQNEFNKGYFSLAVSRKDNEVEQDVTQEEKEDGAKVPRKAIQKLDEDFKEGNLVEEVYFDLKQRYQEKLGRY